MILCKLSPKKRIKATWWMLAIAQFSFVASGILDRFASESLSFIIGILQGISVVGNIFFLTQFRHLRDQVKP